MCFPAELGKINILGEIFLFLFEKYENQLITLTLNLRKSPLPLNVAVPFYFPAKSFKKKFLLFSRELIVHAIHPVFTSEAFKEFFWDQKSPKPIDKCAVSTIFVYNFRFWEQKYIWFSNSRGEESLVDGLLQQMMQGEIRTQVCTVCPVVFNLNVLYTKENWIEGGGDWVSEHFTVTFWTAEELVFA